jgi:hypothetical protein
MPVTFDPGAITEAFNADPEFTLCARYWDGTLEFGVGDDLYTITMTDGKVTDVAVTPHEPLTDADRANGSRRVRISAPAGDWENLVKDPAPPFYLDYYSASAHHDVVLDGDRESLWAYYPAIRRTTDLFRAIASGKADA